MITGAVRGQLREWLAWLHRWTGLAILLFLSAAAASGTALAFRDEIDRWLNPDLFVVVPRGTPATVDEIFDLVDAAFPPLTASSVTFPSRNDEAWVVSLRAPQAAVRQRGQTDALPFNTVFVDPYQRRVLGYRSSLDVAWTRAAVVPSLLRFHYTLLLERRGVWVMGVCAYVWLFTNIAGLFLAWPTVRAGGWRTALSVRTDKGRYGFAYSLHRAAGLWLLPLMTVMAATSVYLAFPIATRSAVAATLPVSAAPAGTPLSGAASIGPERALRTVMAGFPEARARSVFREPRSGWYSVRVRLPDDVAPYGNTQAYVSMTSGNIVAVRSARTAMAGDTVLDWLRPLHTGAAFGTTGRAGLALLGLGVLVINGTALWMFALRRAPRAVAKRPLAERQLN